MRGGSNARCWLLLVVLASCTGCSRRTTPGLIPRSIEHGGRTRAYHVYVPPSRTQGNPAPLVVALHGGGGTGNSLDVSAGGQFVRAAQHRGWIVVFPEGIANGWNDGRPLNAPRERARQGVDDVGFLSLVIDRVATEFSVDRRRVYATGISNGGFMTQRLAIERSDLLAAAASVTASLSVDHLAQTPTRPVPMLLMNGTEDPLVPYQGGAVRVFGTERGLVTSTDETLAWWRRHNGCAETSEVTTMPDNDPNDGTRTVHLRWASCASGAPVELYRVEGGGHAWPGGTQYFSQRIIGRVSRDFAGVEALFAFFADHHR